MIGNGRLFLVDGKTPLQAALVLCEECQKVAKYAALLITPKTPATRPTTPRSCLDVALLARGLASPPEF